MNTSLHDRDWEQQLETALGSAPAPDFDDWCRRHPDAVADLLSPQPKLTPITRRRKILMTALKIAAALLIAGGVMWMGLDHGTMSPAVFADNIPGVDSVQTMTWTTVHFTRVTSEDQKRTWISQTRVQSAYRHPGQYRTTRLDEHGQPHHVEITDLRVGRRLVLDLKEKQAVLKYPDGQHDKRGPFAWVGDDLRGRTPAKISVSLQGQRKIDDTLANVVRWKGTYDGVKHTAEFLFDAESKRLVGISSGNPGSDFDPERSVDEINRPPEENWSLKEPVGLRHHEMVLNAKIDASQFSLDPPLGFSLDRIAKPTVTEDEMLAFLRAAARFNEDTFPDSPYEAYDVDKFNEASSRPAKDRTEAEQALIDIRNRFMMREIYRSPVLQFEEDHAKPNSFHYVGADVKLGQAEQIVGWYQPRMEATYRAFYGDLTVKDVTRAELPLVLAE